MPPRALLRIDHSFTGLSVIDRIEGSPIVRLLNASTADLSEGASRRRLLGTSLG